MFDTLIAGGTVIDPERGSVGPADVAIDRGRILAVEPSIARTGAASVIDAAGLLVTPGLVDLHSHVSWRTSPISVDADSLAPASGVTTWIDAGSAFSTTIESLREHVVERSSVRVLAFLRLGRGTNEIMPTFILAQADADLLAAVARRHRDLVVGLKVSLGQCDLEPLRLALRAAELCELPLMVHIAQAPPPVAPVLEALRPGDIVTHAATGQTMKLVDGDGRVLPAARRARDRGVLFDVGHGAGSFSWATAEALAAAEFLPDTISTDAWQVSVRGPMFDLPTCISKFIHLGMSLREAVRASSSRPAEIVGRPGEFGTLRPGAQADIALLRVVEGRFTLYDTAGESRVAGRLVRAEATLVRGRPLPARSPEPMADWLAFAMAHGGLDPNPQGGVRPAVRQLQEELVRRGHTPTQMVGALEGPVPEGALRV